MSDDMSDDLVSANPASQFADAHIQGWQDARPIVPQMSRSPFERPVAAIRRYRWLLVAIVLLASIGGVLATRFLTPQYEVGARIMIATDNPMESRTGPIGSSGLLIADDWTQLLRSFAVSDAVVRKLALYLSPDNERVDGPVFASFGLADRFRPGKYELVIDRSTKRWTLSPTSSGEASQSGGVADSVGTKFGFEWVIPKWAFDGTGERNVKFTVATPRETAVAWDARLNSSRARESNFLELTLQDPDPKLAADVLNTWIRQYVAVAAELKKYKLNLYARTLEGQLHTAKNSLDSAEVQLSSYRVNTITQPGESSPIAAGLQETRDPVMKAYFEKTMEYDDVKHDVAMLQTLLASVTKDSVPSDALFQIHSVASGAPAAQSLRTAITDYHAAEANLAAERAVYTDVHPRVRSLVAQVNTLKRVTIPRLAGQLLMSLRDRAADDSARIATEGENLQKIPQRTIEEERFRRARDVAAGLFTNLSSRFAEAQLAEASATPDVSILDSAIAPLAPTSNTAPRVILIAIIGGIGLALGLAILFDRLDGRLRYPEQAADDLGLPIAGTIPRFPKGGVNRESPEQMFQLVESFRSLRMAVVASSGPGSMAVAVSSPSPSEGKSLISANLAMSFADAGLRTVLIDGDTRRGALNATFGLRASPGLTDFLSGRVALCDVMLPTGYEKLTIIPCGMRQRRSPELLISPRLGGMVTELQSTHDVVIFDTPPMAAGIDGYSIAAAAGRLLVVLRVGHTDRRMAAEKLRIFERLPVDIIGAVLNGIPLEGSYEYYGYVPGYEAVDEQPGTAVAELT